MNTLIKYLAKERLESLLCIKINTKTMWQSSLISINLATMYFKKQFIQENQIQNLKKMAQTIVTLFQNTMIMAAQIESNI
ncbi:UNKNOWN [Stylonychia lemnae]|uniref:Uncharacterized protein n=1 Tax=Stylonychia lemnae TaxID=5949 RepID=A0A078B144_STYLE|nr:UNKNOWN [Stylonychia lemnae]|eukprot:CDW86823.1 UNKNOWN [Stylonychia lemnae]